MLVLCTQACSVLPFHDPGCNVGTHPHILTCWDRQWQELGRAGAWITRRYTPGTGLQTPSCSLPVEVGSLLPPTERLLLLRLLPKYARTVQHRIPVLKTHQNYTNTVTSHVLMMTLLPGLTCPIQQLVKRRACITRGLSTTAALSRSV